MPTLGRGAVSAAALLALVATSCSHDTKTARPAPPSSASSAAPATTASSVPVPAPTLPNGHVSVVPSSIRADCSVDVTHELQAWIDATPDDATLRLGARACYRVDETLAIKNRDDILFSGNGATLRAFTRGTRNRAHLLVSGSDNVTIQDVTVHGANPHAGARRDAYVPSLEAQAAFQVSGSSRVRLERVAASDVYGDFVYIGPIGANPSTDVTVEESRFTRSGRQGIAISDAVNVEVGDNSISGAGLSLIDLEANSRSATIRHIEILRNVTGAARHFWLADKGADAAIGDVEITGNRMAQPTGGLFFIYGRRPPLRGPFLIQGNQFIASDAVHDENSAGAFFFANATGIDIRNNTVRFLDRMPAVELRDSHHVSISQNRFDGASVVLLPRDGSTDYHVS